MTRPNTFSYLFFQEKSRDGAAKVTLSAKGENPRRGTGRWWSATTCVNLPAAETDRPIIGHSLMGKKSWAAKPTGRCVRATSEPTSHAGGCVSQFASVGCAAKRKPTGIYKATESGPEAGRPLWSCPGRPTPRLVDSDGQYPQRKKKCLRPRRPLKRVKNKKKKVIKSQLSVLKIFASTYFLCSCSVVKKCTMGERVFCRRTSAKWGLVAAGTLEPSHRFFSPQFILSPFGRLAVHAILYCEAKTHHPDNRPVQVKTCARLLLVTYALKKKN